jgi:hypothetical protein
MTEAGRTASGEARQVDVFFYSLFMDAGMLRAQGFDPRAPRLAKVDGMALRPSARATLVPANGFTVQAS